MALKAAALPKENKRPRTIVFTQGAGCTVVAKGNFLFFFVFAKKLLEFFMLMQQIINRLDYSKLFESHLEMIYCKMNFSLKIFIMQSLH